MSLEEQKNANLTTNDFSSSSTSQPLKYDPLGQWQSVDNRPINEKMPDLQLPQNNLVEIKPDDIVKSVSLDNKEKIEFKEKSVANLNKNNSNVSFVFKKRKVRDDIKRNIRKKE